ncbi:MAG: hypothetical protein J6X66_01415 [Lachnospiraceae bacterium]|nr:hypothetical protein [Lachnospiraceae bacterium]
MNMFQEIKDAVSVREAASFYGLKVTRGGMACCPFHDDRTPSMKVDKRFHCFGCGADGDVISFVQKMFDLDSKQAAFRLIDDFHLNIDTNRKESRHEKDRRIRMQKKKEREEKIRAAYAGELRRFQLRMTEIYRTLHEWEIDHQPTREQWEENRVDERYICAVHNKDPVEWILDTIDFGEDNDKFEIYKHREEIINFYERKIAESDRRAAGRCGKGAASDTGA